MFKYYFVAFICLFIILVKILERKNVLKNDISFVIKAILIILLLELTIFNINSYKIDFSNTQEFVYKNNVLSKITYLVTDGTQEVCLKDINSEVKTIFIELNNIKSKDTVEYEIYYGDDTTNCSFLATKIYNDEVSKTKYSAISLSRKCKKYNFKNI